MKDTYIKHLVGSFGGHEVYYIPSIDYLWCKEQTCPLEDLVNSMKNGIDRQTIPNSSNNILLEKKPNNIIILGCLSDTLENYKDIYKKIKKIKKQILV